jgi:hypothetical protein
MEKSKFIFFYDGVPFRINSIKELAEKLFGMNIYRGDNGNWFVELNKNKKRMEYISKENGGGNGYTKEEVEKDFLTYHFETNYKNTALYRLCE